MNNKYSYISYISIFAILFFISGVVFNNISFAASDAVSAASYTLNTRWSGQIKQQLSIIWADGKAFCDAFGAGPYYDANVDFRLKNKTYFTDNIYSVIHYESVVKASSLSDKVLLSGAGEKVSSFLISDNTINDKRRFFNFTKIIRERPSYTVYHRLDRFSLTFSSNRWGILRVGRQAVTWGDGIIFNPMDLFNPFAPTDIDRDYKVGDDMVYTQIPLENTGDLQLLYVPRRNAENGHLEYSCSSLAGKLHVSYGTTEFDFMAAHHYDDFVAGFGSAGYLMDAAWRADLTWTCSQKDSDFLSFVGNMDYSWNWWNRNIYGFVEFYFNGAGDDNLCTALLDTELIGRLQRGDIFFPGRKYLALGTQIEINPLLDFYFTFIDNIDDRSFIVQPRILWDVTENFQAVFGGNLYCGGANTEFGGFKINSTGCIYEPFNNFYIRCTYFF